MLIGERQAEKRELPRRTQSSDTADLDEVASQPKRKLSAVAHSESRMRSALSDERPPSEVLYVGTEWQGYFGAIVAVPVIRKAMGIGSVTQRWTCDSGFAVSVGL